MNDGPSPDAPARSYRRTVGTRVLSSGCALLFAAAAISVGATSGVSTGLVVLSGLALLGLASALGAWADRYTLGAAGIEYRNTLMVLLGGRPRLVPWDEIVQVREHRSLRFGRSQDGAGPLSLVLRSGGRMVLDSLQDFDEVVATVRSHTVPRQ